MRTKPVLALLALILAGCYDPAVRDRLVLTPLPTGQAGVLVETTFKQGKDLTRQERQEIQETLDRYDLGRDPWLRGFERAGAGAITHSCKGTERNPESIRREAVLPSVEALVKAMPDAIANIALQIRQDPSAASRRAFTLSVVHIDLPETIREKRRRLEREIETWSESMFNLSSRQCDLYDYLADRPERRRAVLEAMVEPSAIREALEPREASLLERLGAAMKSAGEIAAPPGSESPAITKMAFSAFDHEFCVKLPSGVLEVKASPGLSAFPDEPGTWCFERLAIEELADRLAPEADPPWDSYEKGLPEDPAIIALAPFSCLRFEGPTAVETRAWEIILPKPWYELSWIEGS